MEGAPLAPSLRWEGRSPPARCNMPAKTFRLAKCNPHAQTALYLNAALISPLTKYGCFLTSCQNAALFLPDYAKVEVIRIAMNRVCNKRTCGEGGERGCFFLHAPGSGIRLHLGKSLRAANRSVAASKLSADVGLAFAHYGLSRNWTIGQSVHYLASDSAADFLARTDLAPLPSHAKKWGQKLFLTNPYLLDYVGCKLARAAGYDTIQYPYFEGEVGFVEVVSCHDHCVRSISRYKLTGACVPGLERIDGSACVCNNSEPILNCKN